MGTVRIQRKRKINLAMIGAWAAFFKFIFQLMDRPRQEANFNAMEQARYEWLTQRSRAEEARQMKLYNDVVLQDMKIEERKMRLKLLQHELDVRGLGKSSFSVDNYTSDRPRLNP